MPIGMLQEMPGMGADMAKTYDAVNEKMDVVNNPPEGMIFHTAGPSGDGGWRIFDVWESKEAFERFSQERLMPAIQEVTGGQAPPAEPRTDLYELHSVIKG